MCVCVWVQLKFCASLRWMAITGRWTCLTRTIGSWSVAQLLMWVIGGWVPPIKGMQCLVPEWHVHRIAVCDQTQAPCSLSCVFCINVAFLGVQFSQIAHHCPQNGWTPIYGSISLNTACKLPPWLWPGTPPWGTVQDRSVEGRIWMMRK